MKTSFGPKSFIISFKSVKQSDSKSGGKLWPANTCQIIFEIRLNAMMKQCHRHAGRVGHHEAVQIVGSNPASRFNHSFRASWLVTLELAQVVSGAQSPLLAVVHSFKFITGPVPNIILQIAKILCIFIICTLTMQQWTMNANRHGKATLYFQIFSSWARMNLV